MSQVLDTKVIITGGTIDKVYNEIQGTLEFLSTRIPELLQQARVDATLNFAIPFLVDSLDMTTEQRFEIINIIENTSENNILITHGTDTIVETAMQIEAEFLSNSKWASKTIVLTGAMIPASIQGSDAMFNLGTSMGVFNSKPPGVYLCFQGKVFLPQNTVKDKLNGIFIVK